MAISDVRTIMGRIKVAEQNSPILVRKLNNGALDAAFADTVESRNIIAAGGSDIVGVYHRNMCPAAIESHLRAIG